MNEDFGANKLVFLPFKSPLVGLFINNFIGSSRKTTLLDFRKSL
jgi:hypothetical protein